MELKTPESSTARPRLKLIVLRWIAFGFGCGVAIALVLLAGLFYSESPRGWNTHALRVKSVRVEPITNLDDNLKAKSKGDIFDVDIENTTSRDVTLPSALTVMQAAKRTGALHGSFLKPDKDYFIPAHHVRSVSLDNSAENLCGGDAADKTCFDNYFADDGEIVLFDDAQKYEIHIPIPSLTLPTNHGQDAGPNSSTTASANPYAPDRGKPWERYAACAEGQRLLPLCKQAHIALADAKAAADGWTPVGSLPTLPKVPNGYKLEPDEHICRTAYEWDYYCHHLLK